MDGTGHCLQHRFFRYCDGLRAGAANGVTVAIATRASGDHAGGRSQTDAIKVLVEHARGLAVAFYLPCHKRFLRGWQFGELMALPAKPEVGAWGEQAHQ
jgi:hypothetical protein